MPVGPLLKKGWIRNTAAENVSFPPAGPKTISSVFKEALAVAVAAHRGMSRRRESAPFILPPPEAAVIAGAMTADPERFACLHGYEARQEYHFMITAVFEGVE